MQATLKNFSPLVRNNNHDKYEDNYKFSVILENNGTTVLGEAWAKNPTGSKSWSIGLLHDYSIKEQQYCDNGKKITGLKVAENAAPAQQSSTQTSHSGSYSKPTSTFDIKKESFVISRFSHTLALDYINSLSSEDKAQLQKDNENRLVSKYAAIFAKNVYKVAEQVIELHEAGNKQTS